MIEELVGGVGEASRSGIFGTRSQTSKVKIKLKTKNELKKGRHKFAHLVLISQ